MEILGLNPQTEVHPLSTCSHRVRCVFVEFHWYEYVVPTPELSPESRVPTTIGLTPVRCILMAIDGIVCHVLTTIGLTPVRY